MKKPILTGVLLLAAALLSGADKIVEINDKGEILLPSAAIRGFRDLGYEPGGGYLCGGTSGILLEADKAFPSMTVAVTAGIREMPQKEAVLFLRPGFHHTLFLTPQGRIGTSLWLRSEDGKNENVKLFSVRTVRPGDGRWFRAALSVARNRGKTVVKLYLDGALEAEQSFDAPPFGYQRMFHVGGAPALGGGINGFSGVLRSFRLFDGALSDDEIASLR